VTRDRKRSGSSSRQSTSARCAVSCCGASATALPASSIPIGTIAYRASRDGVVVPSGRIVSFACGIAPGITVS
jgi:hypothetical protein